MRISDWSSDVCSSDLPLPPACPLLCRSHARHWLRRGPASSCPQKRLAIRRDFLESRSMPNHAGPIRLAGGRSWFSIPGLSAIYALFEPDGAQSQERFTQAATDDDHDRCWKAREDSTISSIGRGDRKSVVSGKSVSVRVDLGGRRMIKKTITQIHNNIH